MWGCVLVAMRLMWGCVLVAMRLMRGEVHWVVTIGNGWLVTLQLAGAIPSQDEGTCTG